MVFGEAIEIHSTSIPTPPDGILGMAWPNITEIKGMSVVFLQLFEQGVVDEPVFGFYLNR